MRSIQSLLLLVVVLTGSCVTSGPRFAPNPQIPVRQLPMLYKTVTLDVVAEPNVTVRNSTLNYLRGKLQEYGICRSDDVRILIRALPTTHMGNWIPGQLRQFETANRIFTDSNIKDNHLQVFIAFVHGTYVSPNLTGVAGLQYGDSGIALFVDVYNSNNEDTLLLHEFGHALNIALACNRKEKPIKEDRPNHCNDKECAMFWQIQGPGRGLGEQCLAEITRMRRRRARRLRIY